MLTFNLFIRYAGSSPGFRSRRGQ